MKNRAPATIAVLLVVLAIVAVPVYRGLFPPARPVLPPVTPGIHAPIPSEPAPTPSPSRTVIFTVSSNGGGDANGLIAVSVPSAHSSTPARDAIRALIASPNSPLPDGTHLRGLKVDDSLATVDFNGAFQTNFHGGDTQEAQTINSILMTLGQFPSIDRVQILVQGKPIDALSQLPINGPLDVIRPQSVQQAQGAGGGA